MTTISEAIDSFQVEEQAANVLRIMDPKEGDLKLLWNADNADEVALVRAQFAEAKKRGLVPYRVSKKGDKTSVMTEFDPHAEGIIMAPPVAGG